jgi:hypothetical protein
VLWRPVRLTAGASAAAVLLLTACGDSSGAPSNGEEKKSGPQVVKDKEGAGSTTFTGTASTSASRPLQELLQAADTSHEEPVRCSKRRLDIGPRHDLLDRRT